jgi:hypothetical protein
VRNRVGLRQGPPRTGEPKRAKGGCFPPAPGSTEVHPRERGSLVVEAEDPVERGHEEFGSDFDFETTPANRELGWSRVGNMRCAGAQVVGRSTLASEEFSSRFRRGRTSASGPTCADAVLLGRRSHSRIVAVHHSEECGGPPSRARQTLDVRAVDAGDRLTRAHGSPGRSYLGDEIDQRSTTSKSEFVCQADSNSGRCSTSIRSTPQARFHHLG